MTVQNSLRFLLLQARSPDDAMLQHEVDAFVHFLGVSAMQLRPFNATVTPPSDDLFEVCDVLLVGGSGDYSLLGGHDWLDGFLSFMLRVVERRFPMFASCFGFQSLGVALGGELVSDPEHGELGTYPLTKSVAAEGDPLFCDLPQPFLAQLGHRDRLSRLPGGVVHLASSERCEFQAMRVEGAPIYATQFHPELDRKRNVDRFHNYVEHYGNDSSPEKVAEVESAHADSPHANQLLGRFVERIVMRGDPERWREE